MTPDESNDALKLLEDDEIFGEIAEEIRAEREAQGLDPDTGHPVNRASQEFHE